MNAIWIAVAAVSLLSLVFGAILGYTPRRFAVEDGPVAKKVNEILPQNQHGQCGYPGYHPYVEAISCNGEEIDRCAPGDEAVMLKIAKLLNVEPQPLDDKMQELALARMVAVTNEDSYIGYTECIRACPVDAIISTTRAIRTVMNNLYTDCNPCVNPCPTHCISPQPVAEAPNSWKWNLDTISMHIIPVEYHA